ncbi:MAG TPA: alpha/beta fold hydrolase [Vicinamibacterales bacterium]
MPEDPRQPRIVLVHGTFARGATWTQPASSLCARLRRSLGAGTRFDAFLWSGANRHTARVAAGRELADYLDAALAQMPTRPVFVIGHSHGGTVITHALRERPHLARALSGIVLLSTPFIQIRRRPHAAAVATLLSLLYFFGFMWGVGRLQVWMSAWGVPTWLVPIVNLALIVGALSAYISVVSAGEPAGSHGPKAKFVSRLDVTVARLRDQFAVRHLSRDRTLILRANADEASAALAWVQAVSRLIGDVIATVLRWLKAILPWVAMETEVEDRRPSGVVHWCAHAVGLGLMMYAVALFVVWMAGAALGVVAIVTDVVGIDARALVTRLLPANADPVGFLVAAEAAIDGFLAFGLRTLLVGASMVLLVGGLTMVLFNRAFGHWFTWTALFVEVSVEAAPPGRWTVRQLEPPDQSVEWNAGGAVTMAHSLSYEDPRAQRCVASWMRMRLRGQGSPQASAVVSPGRT